MKHTLYVPDELAAQIVSADLELNLSNLLQTALRKELTMHAALTQLPDFRRVTVYTEMENRKVAFQGKPVGGNEWLHVWLTPKGQFVVEDHENREYSIHPDFGDLRDNANIPASLIAQIAGNIGEDYIEELDI